MTGTGKTQLLHALANQSEQILDLEALANHRGSSYGALGLPAQPTVEHFENLIAMQWMKLDPNRPVWIEAESRRVGLCRIPDEILTQMMQAPVIQIERSRQERIQLLIEEYGKVDREELIIATERISRKLGGQHAQRAIEYIRQGNLEPAIDIVLNYYDKTYWYDLQRRNVEIHSIEVTGRSEPDSVAMLIETSRQVLKKPIPGFIKQLTPIQ
jgi:tRNA 2-selenouridine synthase